ncbi:hypothetical protein [Bradyrhizobium sp. USDA 4353]
MMKLRQHRERSAEVELAHHAAIERSAADAAAAAAATLAVQNSERSDGEAGIYRAMRGRCLEANDIHLAISRIAALDSQVAQASARSEAAGRAVTAAAGAVADARRFLGERRRARQRLEHVVAGLEKRATATSIIAEEHDAAESWRGRAGP